MAAYVKYEPFAEGLMDKLFDLFGITDTLKVAIASDTPVVATDAQLVDVTQVTGTGYTAGGAKLRALQLADDEWLMLH